jgi:DNA-binding transcriptional LysR family regulator
MEENSELPNPALPVPGLIDQLKKLWMLDLVVRHGSFQKAATHAKVTRSAISQTISHLEQLHGKSLLVRGHGSVSATAYGMQVLEQARPILGSLESLHPLAVHGDRVPRMTWLDLGAFESLAIQIMPKLLERLARKCPGIRVTVKVGRSGRLATLVRKGELCMAIVVENDLLSGLTVIPLATDRLGLYVSSSLPDSLKSLAALDKLPVGGLSSGPEGQPAYMEKFLKSLNLTKRISFSSDSLEAVLAVTAHGAIVGVLPERVALRSGDRLSEITPANLREKNLGLHRICLISEKKCDPHENDFLAAEIKSLMKQ